MSREKPIVAALKSLEKSLTRIEDVLERVVAVVGESAKGVEEIRKHTFKEIDRHGEQLRKQEELLVSHEAELYQLRGGPRIDAE